MNDENKTPIDETSDEAADSSADSLPNSSPNSSMDDNAIPSAEANGKEAADSSVMEQLYNEAEAALDAQDAEGEKDADGIEQEDAVIFALKQEVEKNRAGWQRALADFQNLKRRSEQQLSDSRTRAAQDTITSILPVIDDFERALANVPEDLQGHSWMNGVELILNKLNKLLDEHNITAIDPVGEPFDPTRHEAIGTDDSDEIESGHVTTTLQKGYAADDRVLRPAIVKVAN